MRFIVDLDSTLLDLPVLEQASLNLYGEVKYTMYDARDWCFTTLPAEVRKEAYRLFADPEFMGNLKPVNGAQDFIKALVEHKHDVVICTCRDRNTWDVTRDTVTTIFPGTMSLVIEPTQSKIGAYLELKPDVVIDDCPVNVAQAVMAGVPYVIQYTSDVTPYNYRMLGAFGVFAWDMKVMRDVAERDDWCNEWVKRFLTVNGVSVNMQERPWKKETEQ